MHIITGANPTQSTIAQTHTCTPTQPSLSLGKVGIQQSGRGQRSCKRQGGGRTGGERANRGKLRSQNEGDEKRKEG